MTDARLRLAPELALPADAVTQTFAILAKRGAGKTYTALVLVEELLGAGAQVVVADPVGVCWGLRAAANGKDPGLPIVVMGGDHGDVPLEAGAGKVIAEFIVDTRSSVVVDLALLRKGEQVRFMTDFAETLYHRNRAPLHLVLDEADAFAPQRPLPDQARLLGAMQDLVRRGRARGIGVTLVTQRAAVLSMASRSCGAIVRSATRTSTWVSTSFDAWIQAHDAHGQRGEFHGVAGIAADRRGLVLEPGLARALAPKQLAPVDLDELTRRIAATIERAKADDPRALRARITALERELQTSACRPAPAATERRVEVPVLRDVQIKRLEAVFHGAETLAERTREALAAMVTAATAALEAMRARAAAPPVSARTALIRAQQAGATPATSLARPTAIMVSRRSAPDDTGLSAGERKMLEALALRHPEPLSKAQLGLLAGYAASGGTFRTYLPRLHRAGLVEVRGDRLALTPTGRSAVGEFRHAPQTPEQVRSMWLGALDQGPRRILEVLIGVYPKALMKTELGEASGYEAAGGTFRTYLPKLRRLGLVDVDHDQVRASEGLFS